MTAIINKNRPHNSEYSQYNDKLLGNLDNDRNDYTPTHRHLYSFTDPTQTDHKQALQFILAHFGVSTFPEGYHPEQRKDTKF